MTTTMPMKSARKTREASHQRQLNSKNGRVRKRKNQPSRYRVNTATAAAAKASTAEVDAEVNPYHVLELRHDATPYEIRTAYKRLALLHHPGRGRMVMSTTNRNECVNCDANDKRCSPTMTMAMTVTMKDQKTNGGSSRNTTNSNIIDDINSQQQVFEILSACYETLMNPETRRRYDLYLKKKQESERMKQRLHLSSASASSSTRAMKKGSSSNVQLDHRRRRRRQTSPKTATNVSGKMSNKNDTTPITTKTMTLKQTQYKKKQDTDGSKNHKVRNNRVSSAAVTTLLANDDVHQVVHADRQHRYLRNIMNNNNNSSSSSKDEDATVPTTRSTSASTSVSICGGDDSDNEINNIDSDERLVLVDLQDEEDARSSSTPCTSKVKCDNDDDDDSGDEDDIDDDDHDEEEEYYDCLDNDPSMDHGNQPLASNNFCSDTSGSLFFCYHPSKVDVTDSSSSSSSGYHSPSAFLTERKDQKQIPRHRMMLKHSFSTSSSIQAKNMTKKIVDRRRYSFIQDSSSDIETLSSSSSSSDDEGGVKHFSEGVVHRLFGGPLAPLHRARNFAPFNNPYVVFEKVFGSSVFPRIKSSPRFGVNKESPQQSLSIRYKTGRNHHILTTKSPTAVCKKSTETTTSPFVVVVHEISRMSFGRVITRTETIATNPVTGRKALSIVVNSVDHADKSRDRGSKSIPFDALSSLLSWVQHMSSHMRLPDSEFFTDLNWCCNHSTNSNNEQ